MRACALLLVAPGRGAARAVLTELYNARAYS